ncbi:A/G-specific adenine glycosylase [Parabacteroides bouchesdurhonensis]|uniref:A/G-specific adenine glycosylase n=1 Tax=Parabacteroides bouchesdurhonensis TaxID=1936995 RepID=UPI000E4D5079|nr:A/G-specific adenine glycosylase [Parabacteroides bouchesdurhonensis]RHJ92412.1 A/G-specific adenine glycosylase [Bacteroides sp. AM07-16]
MLQNESDLELSHILIEWYNENKRNLPWRNTNNPYVIWISEVILQQTRVIQGLDYFNRFIGRFPDVASLAAASEDEVLKYWQGLGYYSRARNLRMAAQDIMNRFGGTFPDVYQDILSLKGIGEYTAAAIASFSWNKPFPVVDGNVFRVLSRLYGMNVPIDTTEGKKQFSSLAGLIMDKSQAGVHNQAIMEFGALQCVPQNPDCLKCPLIHKCVANATNKIELLPVKQGKTKTRNRFFYYLYVTCKGKTWLHRREEKDIWTGLYEFPLIETDRAMDFTELQQTKGFRRLFNDAGKLDISIGMENIKHVLSHQIIYATFYKIEIERETDALRNFSILSCEELEKYAVPRLIHIYLEKLGRNL